MIWFVFLVVVLAAAIYLFIIRPVMKTKPLFSPYFDFERTWYEKMSATLMGWKTKISARLLMIAGLMVGLYDQALPFILGQDWTPITSKLPGWALPVGLTIIGFVFEKLRNISYGPPANAGPEVVPIAPVPKSSDV